MATFSPNLDSLLTPVSRGTRHDPVAKEKYAGLKHRTDYCGACDSYQRVSEFVGGTKANPRRLAFCRTCRSKA